MNSTQKRQLPVNAVSAAKAREIANQAAIVNTPKGATMLVGELVDTEYPARPFSKVALEQKGVLRGELMTFVFEVEISRDGNG